MITRPILAFDLKSLGDVSYPMLVSAKLDGIRCIMANGTALSRSFKEIPNNYIRKYLTMNAQQGLDGELITYTDGVADEYNVVQSKVMSEEGQPEFNYAVFDYVSDDLKEAYEDRLKKLNDLELDGLVNPLKHYSVNNLEELLKFETDYVESGYEGIIIRCPKGRYKEGRSTLNESFLLKYKRFTDSEAIILEVREADKNIGKKEVNELGLTKRSHKKADKVKANTMGEFWVKDIHDGREFGIGTGIGLTKELRKEIWNNKDKYIGKIIKYKHQVSGAKNNPRIPSFQGFRDPRDMS